MTYRPDRIRKVAGVPGKKKTRKAPRVTAPIPTGTWQEGRLTEILPIPPVAMRPNGGHGHWNKNGRVKKAANAPARLKTLELLAGKAAPCAVG